MGVMKKQKKGSARSTTFGLAIVGGGSGGRVYPGIAVAKEIKRALPSARITFIGTPKGVEASIVPYEGFAFETLDIPTEKATGDSRWKTLLRWPKNVNLAIQLLKKINPSVLLGTGGEIATTVIYAAYLLHIPTLMLESNRQPSTSYRLLGRSVDKIAVGYAETQAMFPKKKVIVTGNPIRKEFFLIGATPPPNKGRKFNLLIMAGGQGARTINYTMIAALDQLKDYRDLITFTHQTGNADFEYVRAGYEKRDFRADVHQYINDIPRMYAKSHLVIARSGSSTVSELRASGRPAILVPYPHGDNHQEANALALKDEGLARIIAQQQFSGKTLAQEIIWVLEHPEELAQAWSSRQQEGLDAAEQLAQICLQLTQNSGADGFAF